MGLREALGALLGISAYQTGKPASGSIELDSPEADTIRRMYGGQLQPIAYSQTRWYLADVEAAELAADAGSIAQAAALWSAARRDAVVAGLLSTRTGGLVRLPKRFLGDAEIIGSLELGHHAETGVVRSAFDEMCPPQEIALLAADGIGCGVGVAELVPVEGRDYPVLVRLDPRFLVYRWSENRWYFRSFMGLIPITPGDGHWVLHTPGGRNAPWQNGLCWALGRAWVRKTHAALHRDNWEAKLANPARVAKSPAGASDEQRRGWFERVAAWGVNTVFSMPPGYDVALLESNGRGWESFTKTIEEQTREIQIALAGQTVTTDGGTGFANADIHKSIRADLIKETADGLAYTLNTQCIPAFVLNRYGEDALTRCPVMSWDVTPPRDMKAEAEAMNTAGMALKMLTEALEPHGVLVDAAAFCSKFGIPVLGDVDGDGKPDEIVKSIDKGRQEMRPALLRAHRDRQLQEAA